MITNFTKKSSILIILFFLLLRVNTSAQIIDYPVVAETLIRGYSNAKLTVKIDFPACSNLRVTINLGATNAPGIIQYVPGSLIKLSGSANIAQFNITDLRNPIFSITNTVAGESITFTVARESECGFPISTKDNIFVTGTGSGCNFSETNPNQNGYLLRAPALTLNAPAAIANAVLGNVYTRNYNVLNGGNGCIDTLRLYTVFEAGRAKNNSATNSILVNSVSFTPWFTSGDTLFYKVFGATIFNGDNIMCNGETANITETIKILQCNPVVKYTAYWGRNLSNICVTSMAQSNINMVNSVPILSASLPVPNHNYCYNGSSTKQVLRIRNTGSGPATNIFLNLRNTQPSLGTGRNYFDTSIAWQVKDAAGAIIGTVNSFTGVITIANVLNNACATYNGVGQLKGKLTSSIIVPAGSYIDIDVYERTYAFSCTPSNCPFIELWNCINSEISYSNSCGDINYVEDWEGLLGRAYTYYVPNIGGPTDIIGGVSFNLELSYSNLRNIQHPDGSGVSYIYVKLNGTGVTLNTSSVNLTSYDIFSGITSTYPVPVVLSGDSIKIGPMPQNINYDNTAFKLNLIVNCGTSSNLNFEVFGLSKYGSCAPNMKFGCRNYRPVLHCPTPCPTGGATPLNFNLARINFGLPDNDDNHIPDASGVLNKTLVYDHRSVNGDTLQGTWNIKVYENTQVGQIDFGKRVGFVYIDFLLNNPGSTLNPNDPRTLTALPNAVVKIFPQLITGGYAAIPTITQTVSPTFGGTNNMVAHYTLDTTINMRGGIAWQANDSIVFEAKYVVNAFNADRYNKNNVGGTFDYFTNNKVYSTYTAATAPLPDAIYVGTGTTPRTYTCDYFNDYNQFNFIWLRDELLPTQQINGCSSNNLIARFWQYTGNIWTTNTFPYEYRNFYYTDTFKITIPPNFMYRPNSGIVGYSFLPSGTAIANSDVTQVADTLYFNVKNYFTPNGGVLVPGDEIDLEELKFKIVPKCGALSGGYYSKTNAVGIGNTTNTPTNKYTNLPGKIFPTNGWIYTAPLPNISGGGLSSSTDGTVSWTVALQNSSTTSVAANGYFTISPSSNIFNVKVKELGVDITPVNGLYYLGNLNGNASRSFVITANVKGCNLDSISLNYGWGCLGYPANVAAVSCTNSVILKVDNGPSQIQLNIDRQPTAPNIPLCESDEVEFIYNSAQTSFVDNPIIRVIPPTGVIIDFSYLEYPLGSGNFEAVTPVLTGGVYVYNLKDHTGILPIGIPGTVASPSIDGRAVKLLITYRTTCDFASGSRFFAQIRGTRPCGENIPTAQGFNAFLRTDPIFITNSPAGSLFSFNLGLSSTLISCGVTRISGSITPIGGPSTTKDTIIVNLPAGLMYNGGFTSSAGVSVVPGYPAAGPGGSQILLLKIPSGMPSGGLIDYGFDIIANAASGCNAFNIYSEVKRSYSPLSCGVTPCGNDFAAIIGSESTTLIVSRPNPQINYLSYVSGNLIAGDSAIVNVTITNNHPSLNVLPNTLAVEFYCGVPGNLFVTKMLPIGIGAMSSITYPFNLNFVGTPLCRDGDVLSAVIRPASSACICDSTRYILPGSVLPVRFLNITATKIITGSLLKFNVAENANNVLFIIQRSTDGVNFSTIGTIRGTSALNYEYLDAAPINDKINYYRVVQQSNTANASRTNIVSITYTLNSFVHIIAAQNTLNWVVNFGNYFANKTKEIVILNTLGQIVFTKIITQQDLQTQISTSAFKQGNYIIKVIANNELVLAKKVIKLN